MINKVALYYRFTPLADPDAIRLWQTELCTRLGLTGRIIVSRHGINGTVGGDVDAVKQYAKQTRAYPAFADLDVKWSDGTGQDFPRLSVRVREEVVTFGVGDEVVVDRDGIVGGGQHLTPEELHTLVADRGEEVAFFDGRNAWEASIGRFAGAVVSQIDTTADFVRELDSGRHDALKDRPVVTYCTGGVRCEVLSALMINRGFTEVYQLDGGIIRYGQTYGDDGLWQGSLRVFDGRGRIDFSDHTAVIGACERCGAPTSDHVDCTAPRCKGRALLCGECAADPFC
ncbi:MAG: rhodanese-related sulfurtransferase, partial [Propionibacteriales bacterium]|nr:rhodanese-related sulfurtransferase [Propionibacteriales bacterium]